MGRYMIQEFRSTILHRRVALHVMMGLGDERSFCHCYCDKKTYICIGLDWLVYLEV
jgi:hypothetical protein